ncbi:MAG: N-acetylmuramoyl-L-alanine amidase [Clostridia bacterium]|nr:N-acetylmuramoyl-L-alanine amidase [Clostridia bacterium]
MDTLDKLKKEIMIVFVICLIAGFGYIREAIIPTSAIPENFKTVIIDPGHGGFDGGAGAADGTLEKDINLQISLKTRDFLSFYGYNVIMTRTDDTGTEDDSSASISLRKKSDLKNRLELMGEYVDSVYVSIHLNKFTTSSVSGAQVFYSPGFSEAKQLGEHIQGTIISLLQPFNHRTVKMGSDSTYLLKNATIPAVIVECGFLSNQDELNKLKDNNYQNDLAFCIASGVTKYYLGQ